MQTLVETIILYGHQTATLTAKEHKRLDETYTNLLHRAQNGYCSEHSTRERIVGNLSPTAKRLGSLVNYLAVTQVISIENSLLPGKQEAMVPINHVRIEG